MIAKIDYSIRLIIQIQIIFILKWSNQHISPSLVFYTILMCIHSEFDSITQSMTKFVGSPTTTTYGCNKVGMTITNGAKMRGHSSVCHTNTTWKHALADTWTQLVNKMVHISSKQQNTYYA